MARKILYWLAEPEGGETCRLLLLENDGTEVARYDCRRSFRRIERDGVWWRLNGRDAASGEWIMLREAM